MQDKASPPADIHDSADAAAFTTVSSPVNGDSNFQCIPGKKCDALEILTFSSSTSNYTGKN